MSHGLFVAVLVTCLAMRQCDCLGTTMTYHRTEHPPTLLLAEQCTQNERYWKDRNTLRMRGGLGVAMGKMVEGTQSVQELLARCRRVPTSYVGNTAALRSAKSFFVWLVCLHQVAAVLVSREESPDPTICAGTCSDPTSAGTCCAGTCSESCATEAKADTHTRHCDVDFSSETGTRETPRGVCPMNREESALLELGAGTQMGSSGAHSWNDDSVSTSEAMHQAEQLLREIDHQQPHAQSSPIHSDQNLLHRRDLPIEQNPPIEQIGEEHDQGGLGFDHESSVDAAVEAAHHMALEMSCKKERKVAKFSSKNEWKSDEEFSSEGRGDDQLRRELRIPTRYCQSYHPLGNGLECGDDDQFGNQLSSDRDQFNEQLDESSERVTNQVRTLAREMRPWEDHEADDACASQGGHFDQLDRQQAQVQDGSAPEPIRFDAEPDWNAQGSYNLDFLPQVDVDAGDEHKYQDEYAERGVECAGDCSDGVHCNGFHALSDDDDNQDAHEDVHVHNNINSVGVREESPSRTEADVDDQFQHQVGSVADQLGSFTDLPPPYESTPQNHQDDGAVEFPSDGHHLFRSRLSASPPPAYEEEPNTHTHDSTQVSNAFGINNDFLETDSWFINTFGARSTHTRADQYASGTGLGEPRQEARTTNPLARSAVPESPWRLPGSTPRIKQTRQLQSVPQGRSVSSVQGRSSVQSQPVSSSVGTGETARMQQSYFDGYNLFSDGYSDDEDPRRSFRARESEHTSTSHVIRPMDDRIDHVARSVDELSRGLQGLRVSSEGAKKESVKDQVFSEGMQDLDSMPETETPAAVKSQLMAHQRMALHWMQNREKNNIVSSLFWDKFEAPPGANDHGEGGGYINLLTGEIQGLSRPPMEARGGILADDMGLGKTITVISLIVSEFQVDGGDVQEPVGPQDRGLNNLYIKCMGDGFRKDSSQTQTRTANVSLSRPTDVGPTLIVAPLSVLQNWQSQIVQHTKGSLKVLVYHGSGRTKSCQDLMDNDIVLTTYNVLAAEYSADSSKGRRGRAGSSAGSLLHRVQWHRVVLDEAHTICNPNAKSSKSAMLLSADRRWAVTGTPIQNKIEDLYALLSFVKVRPVDDAVLFKRTITEAYRSKNEDRRDGAMRLVRQVMKVYCLRRMKTMQLKGKPIVTLPHKTEVVRHLELTPTERTVYNELHRSGRALFKSALREGTVMSQYTKILARLLRLRQLCCHPSLIPAGKESEAQAVDDDEEETNIHDPERLELIKKMEDKMAAEEQTCAFCLDTITQPTMTRCFHIFCAECFDGYIRNLGDPCQPDYRLRCPMCRADVQQKELVTFPAAAIVLGSVDGGTGEGEEGGGWEGGSTKLDAVLAEIERIEREHPGEKMVIFSQFTSFLNIIEKSLVDSDKIYRRLDGTMTRPLRSAAIDSFQNDANVKIMLISIKSGGTGLNLVAANHVLITDLWWNSAVEEQAVDRVHRFGQQKPVSVVRFVIKDTVEERIVQLQQQKALIIQGALGTEGTNVQKDVRETRTQELGILFS